jgi:hypothetical protein
MAQGGGGYGPDPGAGVEAAGAFALAELADVRKNFSAIKESRTNR